MNRLQSAIIILVMAFSCLLAEGQSRYAVVADSISHAPLANASVFDPKGKLIGITRTNGQILIPSTDSYPITVRYLGYIEKHILKFGSDTIFLQENVTELPEVIVAATKKKCCIYWHT